MPTFRLALLPLLLAALLLPAASHAGPLAGVKEALATGEIAKPKDTVNIDVNLPDRKYAGMGQGPCGQFAMGIVLDHLGVTVDMEKIFRESNPAGGSFTAPSNIHRYMRSQGVDTDIRNRSQLGDIKREVDAGRVCMAMISTSDTAHWIAITGYKTDASGNMTSILMSDSAYGNGDPKTYEMPIDEFNRVWNHPLKNYGPVDAIAGYDRLLITFGAKGSHDPSALDLFGNFGTAMNDAFFGGANSAVVGWNRKDPVQMAGGALQALGGLVTKVAFDGPGSLLQGGGNFLDEKGKQLRDKGGAASVAGVVVQGAGKVVEGAGTVVRGAGNVVATGWNAVTGGFKSLFGGF